MKFEQLAPQLLCPPGEGVFTVHTGREKRERLQASLFGKTNPREAWLKSFEHLPFTNVALLGVASDCGGGIQRGANWGPLFIREALLADGAKWFDLGDVRVIPHLLHDKYLNQTTLERCREALYGNALCDYPVSPLSIAEEIARLTHETFPQLRLLTFGGDHSVSYPMVRAWAQTRKTKNIALLHFDAHTDLLDHRLGIDVCFGTWTHHIREFFPHPDQLIQVGIRATGKDRGHWEKLGLTQIWASEALKKGMPHYTYEVLEAFKRARVEEVYISFDIDALDSQWAQATGTPEEKGLDPMACAEMIRQVSQHFKVTGADLMEVAPFVNQNFRPNNAQETTLMTAAAMARALLRAMGQDA